MLVFKIANKGDGSSTLERSPRQACDSCKLRKLKCDRLEPCTACTTTCTSCTYEATPGRRGRPPIARQHRRQRQKASQSRTMIDSSSSLSSSTAIPVGCTGYHSQAETNDGLFNSSTACHLPCAAETSLELNSELEQLGEFDFSFLRSWQQPVNTHTPPSTADYVLDQSTPTPSGPAQFVPQYPLSAFTYWTRVFIMRLYPVFPIVDPGFLLSKLSLHRDAVPQSMARFFAAMSAAVIVQLNMNADSPSTANSTTTDESDARSSLADRYIAQCAKQRQDMSFIEDADEWTILESFFTFSYYGNQNNSKRAWYYLREAIGFAVSLGLDREESYKDPDFEVNERRRRLYWLLFVTERAYSLQHQTSATLQASITLPQIYDGCDEATLRGFINLVKLFVHVDAEFVTSWCTQSIKGNGQAVLKLLETDCFEQDGHMVTIDETQKADITITQCWLQSLAWRLQNKVTTIIPQNGSGHAAASIRKAARGLLSCFSGTRRDAIESHGIGMEQKLYDIAGFMCDLLPTQEPNQLTTETDSIPNLLHNFMCLLVNFRNQESRYLGPLAERATGLLIIHGASPMNYDILEQFMTSQGRNTTTQDGEEWCESGCIELS